MSDDDETWGGGTLAGALRDLERYAQKLFATKPQLRSVMMCVAQYWSDEADDAVHAFVVASERSTPLWPHICAESAWNEDNPEPIAGEICESCTTEMSYFPCDDNGSSIPVFEPYCHEHGSQEELIADNYTPFAVARRTDDGIAIEFVGTLYRPDRQLLDQRERDTAMRSARPLDARAKTLLLQVFVAARDDAPRRVLADYLIEQDDPRGEYISLALSELDQEGRERRDALLEEHRWSWLQPLGAVIPKAHARFERGLLASADVEVGLDDLAVIENAIGWGAIEKLHFLPGSVHFVSPVMRALREVGPLGSEGLAKLVKGTQWAIEHLRVALATPADEDQLIAAQLPKLKHLSFELASGVEYGPPYDKLRTAPWWNQLERVTWLRDLEGSRPWLASLSAITPVPWIAVSDTGGDGKQAGWNVAMSKDAIEVTMQRWTPTSTRKTLLSLLEALPDLPITLRPSTTWEPTADDVAAIASAGRRAAIA